MRLTPKMQTALLFCLYLTRAGKAHCHDMAEVLKSDYELTYDIVDALQCASIITVDKGDCALVGNPTVADVLRAVSPKPTLTAKEAAAYRLGQHEHRALALFADTLSATVNPLLNRTIRGIGNDLVIAELAQMDSARENGRGN